MVQVVTTVTVVKIVYVHALVRNNAQTLTKEIGQTGNSKENVNNSTTNSIAIGFVVTPPMIPPDVPQPSPQQHQVVHPPPLLNMSLVRAQCGNLDTLVMDSVNICRESGAVKCIHVSGNAQV